MINVKLNGNAPVLAIPGLATAAWENALRRRDNRPTMPNVYHPNRTQRIIRQAYEDGLYLCALWIGGLAISKEQTKAQGMSVARWYYARAMLSMARLLVGERRQRLVTTDEATLRSRLETAFNRAKAHPELFYARLPAHVRRKNQRKL